MEVGSAIYKQLIQLSGLMLHHVHTKNGHVSSLPEAPYMTSQAVTSDNASIQCNHLACLYIPKMAELMSVKSARNRSSSKVLSPSPSDKTGQFVR
jgi:hypothetical protein